MLKDLPKPNLHVASACLGCLLILSPSAPARQFTDAQGRTIEADVVGASETHVVLKRAGRTFKVALEKLSAQDQLYIGELRAEGERRRKLSEARAAVLSQSGTPKKSGADGKSDFEDDGNGDFVVDAGEKGKPEEVEKEPVEPVKDKPASAGKIAKEKFEGENKEVFECYVYKPTTMKPDQARPVMYVLAPSAHGAMDDLKKYVTGAETCGFLLVMPIYPQGTKTPVEEIDKLIIEKTMAGLPIDDKRVFLSGLSPSADRAYRLSAEVGRKAVVGILACDAGIGLSHAEVDRSVVLYVTCGAGSRRRYEVAYTFEKLLKGKDNRLRFFMGSNTWPPEALITEGMMWLNLCSLSGASARDTALTNERLVFAQALLKEAADKRENDPVAAYKLAEMVRDTVTDAVPKKAVAQLCMEIEKNEEIKAYLAGREETEKFVARYLGNEDPRKRDMKKEDRSAQRTGERLAEEYKDTEWGALLGRMGASVL